jgi:hypothetical protein
MKSMRQYRIYLAARAGRRQRSGTPRRGQSPYPKAPGCAPGSAVVDREGKQSAVSGISLLTGILLGVQSYYTAAGNFYDFLVLFTAILLTDVLISPFSGWIDRTSLRLNDKLEISYWTLNNTFF